MRTKEYLHDNICFIVGSPRSGTTILLDVLGRHPEVASFSEPYFIWDWHNGPGEDDIRTAADLTYEAKNFIENEFLKYLNKSNRKLLLEKTPENSFRIDYMNKIFPNAKWIHILRDGRDVVVSINREWVTREKMVKSLSVSRLWKDATRMLSRQKFLRNKILALRHELGQRLSFNPRRYFNKAKWGGRAAWGPRFCGWKEALDTSTNVIEFNSLQWKTCIEAVEAGLEKIEDKNKLIIKYEKFAAEPEKTLQHVYKFLGLKQIDGLGNDLSSRSVGQWVSKLSDSDKKVVDKVLHSTLDRLGYCD